MTLVSTVPVIQAGISMSLRSAAGGKDWMRLKPVGVLLTAAMLGFASKPVFAQQSITTHHNYEQCREAPSPEPDVIEVRRCKGRSGTAVFWMSEPDSSSVSFGKSLDEDMGLGAAFEAGPSIEWRSSRNGGRPAAAIVRYMSGDSVGKLNKVRLVVHRLEPSGRSCIMGVIAGDNAGKARALVDRSADDFVCGKSKRASGK